MIHAIRSETVMGHRTNSFICYYRFWVVFREKHLQKVQIMPVIASIFVDNNQRNKPGKDKTKT